MPDTPVRAAEPTQNKAIVLPPTGAEYLRSLQDDREVWIYGKRVKDVTSHPAFRNSARSIARLYDALHDSALHGTLTVPTDTGNGGFTHAFFRATRTKEDLEVSRTAIETWQRMNFGWMGRTPDYKAAFIVMFKMNQGWFAPHQAAAERWYREIQEKVLFLNHAIIDPPVDRNKPPDEVEDVYVHAVKETDAGIIVTGAKVVATGSALTQANFVAHHVGHLKKPEYMLAFVAPMNVPGVKLICRHSYEFAAAAAGSPFDYPLSSRMDENDAILVFDNALIPWENVLHYRDLSKQGHFMLGARSSGRGMMQAFTRLMVKLEFITGLTLKASTIAGTGESWNVQVLTGELIMWRHIIKGLLDGLIGSPEELPGGFITFNETYATALRAVGPMVYTRMRDIVQRVCTSSLIYLNSNSVDFKTEELRPYLDRYLRGSAGVNAETRSKVMKLLWDSVSSEFGARHELYERNYLSTQEECLRGPLFHAKAAGQAKVFEDFVEQCMAEYDLDGWKLPGFFNGEDISALRRI